MTGPAIQQPEVHQLPRAVLQGLADARATLRFIRLALTGLSIEAVDDQVAVDIRSLADMTEQVVGQLRAIEQIAIPKHGEAVH